MAQNSPLDRNYEKLTEKELKTIVGGFVRNEILIPARPQKDAVVAPADDVAQSTPASGKAQT